MQWGNGNQFPPPLSFILRNGARRDVSSPSQRSILISHSLVSHTSLRVRTGSNEGLSLMFPSRLEGKPSAGLASDVLVGRAQPRPPPLGFADSGPLLSPLLVSCVVCGVTRERGRESPRRKLVTHC
jgi:hypothetical protein